MSDLNQIHVNSSTGLSLNDRFTVISARRRSRSASRSRDMAPIDRTASLANRRLLEQLSRKHKLQTAAKLKKVC